MFFCKYIRPQGCIKHRRDFYYLKCMLILKSRSVFILILQYFKYQGQELCNVSKSAAAEKKETFHLNLMPK